MKIIALLPMKSHSERVPDKNIKNFCGKPLFHAVLSTLLQSEYIDKVIIDTDSDFIKENASNSFERVLIIDRPKEIRGDFVPMNHIIAHDICVAETDHFLQTHSTNPLLTKGTLERAIRYYFDNLPEHDSLFSVNRIQSRLFFESGKPVNHNPNELMRTQDLPPLFEENSNLYLFSRKSFLEAGNNRIGLRPKMFVMEKLEAIDIDMKEDWELAEALFKSRKHKL